MGDKRGDPPKYLIKWQKYQLCLNFLENRPVAKSQTPKKRLTVHSFTSCSLIDSLSPINYCQEELASTATPA